jgi:hypothetical protein
MKKTSLPLLLIFLSGCQMDKGSSEAHKSNSIVMQCTGEEISEVDALKRQYFSDELIGEIEGKENYSYLIKVEDRPRLSHLEYYSGRERRFVPSICFLQFTECQASVDSDVIFESGNLINSQNGSIMETISTTINRRTGEMQTRRMGIVTGVNKIFNGSCEPGKIPDETPQKF